MGIQSYSNCPLIISDSSELTSLEDAVQRAAVATVNALRISTHGENALQVLQTMKFDLIGFDPLKPDRPLNLIEQVNQTATYLVTFRAVEYLFEHLPNHAPFRLNIGARAGTDIESLDGQVAAEVFAATSPSSNRKLQRDIEKVRMTGAVLRYVFFAVAKPGRIVALPDVKLVQVTLDGSSPAVLHPIT